MPPMERKRNKLNPKVFEEAAQRFKSVFPYEGIKMGFYSDDPQGASVFGGIAKVAKTVLMSISGNSINIRAYREPKQSVKGVLFKVDEYRNVDQPIIEQLDGSEVLNHHIGHNAYEDMMTQNQMTFESVPDGAGGLKPNIRPDGTVKTYVNFPDPTSEMLRDLSKRTANRTEVPKEDSKDL